MLSGWLPITYENFRELLNLSVGLLKGAKAPLPKNGYFKAEGLISGWVGKIRNNPYFRVTRQHIKHLNFNFKICYYSKIP